jgi:hypothetical protein
VVTAGAAVLVGTGLVVGAAACVVRGAALCTGGRTDLWMSLARLDFVVDRLLGTAAVVCAAVGAGAPALLPAVTGLLAPVDVVALAEGTRATVR